MNSHFRSKLGVSVLALAGITAMVVTPRVHADNWDKMTRFTFSEPTQVQDTYLEPGTYMFKLLNSSSDRHIVQIFTSDRSHLINTIMTIPAYRPIRTGGTVLTFWETPPGTAKAVRDWYWPGDYDGQEFMYPANLRQVAAVTPPSLPAPALPAAPPAVTEESSQATAAPEPQAQEVAPPQEQAPVEIAQNEPPPPAPAPEPAPQAAPADQSQDNSSNSQSQSLPQTGSSFPLLGMGGLLCFGLYFGVRPKRVQQ